MKDFKITRTGKAPLKFTGEIMTSATTVELRGKDQIRWFEIAIYKAESMFVAGVAYRSQWDGETEHFYVEVFSTMPEISAALSSRDPIPPRIGWPERPEFSARQAALLADLRSQYDWAVSQVLSDFPEQLT